MCGNMQPLLLVHNQLRSMHFQLLTADCIQGWPRCHQLALLSVISLDFCRQEPPDFLTRQDAIMAIGIDSELSEASMQQVAQVPGVVEAVVFKESSN